MKEDRRHIHFREVIPFHKPYFGLEPLRLYAEREDREKDIRERWVITLYENAIRNAFARGCAQLYTKSDKLLHDEA